MLHYPSAMFFFVASDDVELALALEHVSRLGVPLKLDRPHGRNPCFRVHLPCKALE